MFRMIAPPTLAVGALICGLAMGSAGAADSIYRPYPLAYQTAQSTGSPPIYVPPRRGGPTDVAPAATRSGPIRHKLKLLGPDHTGLTITAQPTLYMYVGETARLQLLLTRTGDSAAPPVASFRLDANHAPAIIAFQLGVSLETGAEYRLTAMSVDRTGSIRASDSVQLMRVSEPPELAVATAAASLQARARLFASSGVWYDALHALGQAVAEQPASTVAHGDRAALLDQAGMPEIAAFDRRAAPRG